MTAPIKSPLSTFSPKVRPVLVMEPALAPLFRTLGEPYACIDDVTWEELDEVLARSPPATIVVADPYAGRRNGECFPRVRDLLRRFPSVPVVAAVDLSAEIAPDIRILMDWGVAEILSPATEATAAAVEQRLEQVHARPLKRSLERVLSRYVGREARGIVNAAAEVAVDGGQAPELADRLGVGPRTLNQRCARAGVPAPRQLQAWMRVLLAALLLDDPGRTVYAAAYAAGYRTDRSLRRAITGFLGVDSTALRRAGAFATAGPAFDLVLRNAREAERERRTRRERRR